MDPASNTGTLLTHELPEARQVQLRGPARLDPLIERRAEIVRICEELGSDDVAARFEAAPDALCITRLSDGMIRAANDNCIQLLGFSQGQCASKTVAELSSWTDPVARARFTTAVREYGEITALETRLRRLDGTTVPVSSGCLLELEGEQFALSAIHDITERKRAEDDLRQSEEHYRSIVTAMDEGLIFVDQTGEISSLNPAAERILGYPAQELVGQSLAALVAQGRHIRVDGSPLPVEEHPSLFTLRTGEPQSCRVLGVERGDKSLVWVSVNSQPLMSEGETAPHGSVTTFRDITAQLEAEAELGRREGDLERLLDEREDNLELVEKLLASAVRVITGVVEMRDPYTAGHQRRVSELATRIAQEMKMTAAQVEEIRVAASIHDVGKIAVPAEILSRPGTLSALEFSLIKVHAEAGYRVISSAEMAGDTAEIVYQHHERCDGSGYPRGLSGDALLLGAKVLMVADVVEAMTSHRPYRAALGLDAAVEEVERGAGGHYDAGVCRACIAVVRQEGFAFSEP